MIDIRYLLSEYANSPRLMKLINGISQMLSTEEDTNQFYNNIFNIMTANTFGLNIWGVILNIPRELNLSIPGEEDIYYLPNETYRLLLLCKAMSNVSNCTVENLAEILNVLFKDRGKVYVFDTGTMTMSYVFDFYLEPYERAILDYPGVPPKPTGVGLKILELPQGEIFGFNGTGFQPFNQAPFRAD